MIKAGVRVFKIEFQYYILLTTTETKNGALCVLDPLVSILHSSNNY